MRLSDLSIGEKGKVIKVDLSPKMKAKFGELGVFYGEAVILLRRGMFGDPIEISVLGYNLAIRKSEANKIIVVKIDD